MYHNIYLTTIIEICISELNKNWLFTRIFHNQFSCNAVPASACPHCNLITFFIPHFVIHCTFFAQETIYHFEGKKNISHNNYNI